MSLRVVKGLVIVMSIALVAGFIVLMVGLARQAMDAGEAAMAPPFRTALALPAGARIAAIAGVGDRLAVLVELPDGSREIRLLDPRSGALAGVVAAE